MLLLVYQLTTVSPLFIMAILQHSFSA